MIQVHSNADISLATGTAEWSPAFLRKTCLLVSSALVDLDEGKTTIQVTKPNNHTFIFDANTTLHMSASRHHTRRQTSRPCQWMITKYPDEAEAVINHLFVNPGMKAIKWYPKPETCSEPDKPNAIEPRMWHYVTLRSLTRPNPMSNG